MTTRSVELLVCGGGPAGHAAVQAFRASGGSGAVLLVTDEGRPPYARPPLSKGYLRGELQDSDLPLAAPGWYDEQGVELALATSVHGIDAAARVARVGGEPVEYGSCLLATGAEPATLPVPGGDHPAIRHLRRPADSDRIRTAAARGPVVVVGSGFIGCEVAASLAATGASVTLVTDEHQPQARRLGPEAGERIAAWLGWGDVGLVLGAAVAEIRDGRTLVLDDGRELVAETVVVGAGVRPRVLLAESAGLAVEHGRVPCDASMRTSLPGLLVAGDLAYAWNDAAGRRLVVEHWGEAQRMGEIAGRTAAGVEDAWSQVPGFWSAIGTRKLKYSAWGDGFDTARFVADDHGAFAVYYARGGAVVGVLAHERDDVHERAAGLVAQGVTLAEALRADDMAPGRR